MKKLKPVEINHPGWYWAFQEGFGEQIVRVVRVNGYSRHRFSVILGDGKPASLMDFDEFHGPIPNPWKENQ